MAWMETVKIIVICFLTGLPKTNSGRVSVEESGLWADCKGLLAQSRC